MYLKENLHYFNFTLIFHVLSTECRLMQKTINRSITETLKLNQWNSTKDVINWFKNINDKHLCKSLQYLKTC